MKKELEPYVKLAPFVGTGLVVVAAVVAVIFYTQRGAHIELTGAIQKVRTIALDENSSAAIIDFHIENPSDYSFVVRQTAATMVDPNGTVAEGMVVSDGDTKRLFQYFPILGQMYNSTLVIRTKVEPHQGMDRMLAVRFEVPEKILQQRKDLRIRLEEINGPQSEITEAARH
jgi:hypothetical protein